MNKKILLVILLSTTISSSNALARNFEINYLGEGRFSYDGTVYPEFRPVGDTLIRQNFNDDYDDVIMPDEQKVNLFFDVINNVQGVKTDFIRFIARTYGKSEDEIRTTLNEGLSVLETLTTAQKKQMLTAIDIDDVIKLNSQAFRTSVQYSKDLADNQNRAAVLQQQYFTAAAQNPNLAPLIIEYRTLKAIDDSDEENLTPAQELRYDQITKTILTSADFTNLRNTPENTETLKNIIANIQQGTSSPNDIINSYGYGSLKKLTRSSDTFLVTNPTDASKVPSVQKSDSAVSEGLMASLLAGRAILDSRIQGFSGIASGDLTDTYGAWVQGSFTHGRQKAYNNAPEYKFDQKGFTIGADAGDETLLGVAYSYFANDLKNKLNSKNKEDIKAHIFSLYGKFDFTNEIFAKGQGQLGKSDIKKTRGTGDLANNVAKAKTHGDIIAGKLEAGYNYELNPNVNLIPTIGVSYSDIKIKGYTEKGLGLNRTVGKRTTNRTSGLLGFIAAYNQTVNSSLTVTPEVHANIDYAFKTKNSATVVTIFNGLAPIATPSEKLPKAYYNVGTSLKALRSGKYEVQAGYDLGLAKKFNSHTGMLKLRVNM